MKQNEICTIQDLIELENRISKKLEFITQAIQMGINSYQTPNYLRSKGARVLLKVSENKLRTMRENGELPYSYIGSTYYYSED